MRKATKATRDAVVAANEQTRITEKAMIASTRAWLTPVTMKMVGSKEQQQITAKIIFGNVGKEPAIDFAAEQDRGFVDIPNQKQNWFDVFKPSTLKDVCARTNPVEGASVRFPSGLRDYVYEYTFGIAVREIAAIKSRGKAFYVHGCFAYRTFGKINKSEYCFMAIPIEIIGNDVNFRYLSCPYGNKIHRPPDQKN